MNPQDSLRQSADVFEERGRVYGDAYKNFGHVLMALRPSGFAIRNVEDANRLGVFTQIVSKIVRYANQFEAGGHDDSLLDLSTYAAMLRELDEEGRIERFRAHEAVDVFADMPKEPHATFPVGESVVPRGDGFRVGEIEPAPKDASYYQFREIGEGQDWRFCSKAIYDGLAKDPHIDTRELSAHELRVIAEKKWAEANGEHGVGDGYDMVRE